MLIRSATHDDADGMSRVLREIIAATGRDRPSDPAFVRSRYLDDPNRIRCSVAVGQDGRIAGFQSLILAAADNPYEVAPGWGIIGTHISPRAHRSGIGRALFAASRGAAQAAGLTMIDAYIAADNAAALGYYEAMGFRRYRQRPGIVQKVFAVSPAETA